MAGNAYLFRMPLGISGAVTRLRDLTTEPATLDPTKVFTKYGLAGKYDGEKLVPLEDGDTVDLVVGFLVRPYPTHSPEDREFLGVTVGTGADVLKRGYFSTAVPSAQASAAVKNGKVYVRVAGATDASPLGSLVLTPDATAANTPELTIAKVMGPGDNAAGTGLGHVEIAYNI
ncbi:MULTISPECIES: structural cement protein Gp24 [Klebsiella]|uniref:structural cement protein Gp24 n=1 Tax=Klebsiella TaxID=570 RepID=UPI0006686A7B|nr:MULTISPECIES: hypothetical protein [Klebsiella]EGT0068282.1 hypothetical protein [Klebsiella michiganensis]VTM71687.1 Uncharacterised protein [Raoultella planticola]HCT2143223.1 hypothetical protein [Raoultella ornithinolytica]EKQ7273612.1 hypothetical protein [Klebsiella pneumoniae]EKZ6414264.1 hypothetical protein [Klebsiella pneumoniae]